MFEGMVHRVLVGYLGRYVRNFQKDQLKLSLWNEEVLLENVELIPEAFDYLQLPFAIKQGRVGRLSIKISWKKLGWDQPIIIVLEDIFICASERDEHEWSMEAVETREYAGKKAKLAAAELAKLSRRVCDNQAGKSFISYITAKVLDSIQMSIRNFHVQYSETQPNSVFFGLKFSALTIKQSLVGSSGGKTAGGQVNKIVDIKGLEIYSMTSKGPSESNSLNDTASSTSWSSERSEGIRRDHLLHPFDVTTSLVVNRSGKPDNDMAQYSIGAEVTGLEMSLDEVQLQQILILSDHICISRLREKYGRYRPWHHSLSRKQNGWQILWWHYALESVLSDVRKKLKKTSWRYLGQRLNSRRKYINLYKIKLGFIQQEQTIDEYVLRELEQMEKESDIDDILNYRAAAEHELQGALPNYSYSNMKDNGASIVLDKSRHDDNMSGRSRGWLNWLSRGMLGAGGTDDSTQFSGVVSDEVVKDIYEATKFHPLLLSSSDVDATDKMFTCSIKFRICQIAVAFQSRYSSQKFAHLVLKDTVIDCKLWEELTGVMCSIKLGKLVNPCNGRVVLQIGRPLAEKKLPEDELTSSTVQVDVSQKLEVEHSVKVLLQPFEVNYDMEFFLKCVEFFAVLKSIEFQQKRVLWSLNGFKDVKTRLLLKAEHALSSRSKLSWDVSILNVIINIPGRDDVSEKPNMVLELGSLLYTSSYDLNAVLDKIREEPYILKQFSRSTFTTDFLTDFPIQNLYNYFAVKIESLELELSIPQRAQTVTVLEKLCASLTFSSCLISDESVLKQLEVYVILPSVVANFSLPIYESILALVAHLDSFHAATRSLIPEKLYPRNVMLNQPWDSAVGFSITAKLMSMSFHVDIARDGESSSELVLFLQESNISYSHTETEECIISAQALRFATSSSKGENEGCILFSFGNQFASDTVHHQVLGCGSSSKDGNCGDKSLFPEGSFQLHYKSNRSGDFVFHEYSVGLNEVDLHCHPQIFGRLVAFYERLSSYDVSSLSNRSFSHVMDKTKRNKRPGFHFLRFGYSNFSETASIDCDSISLDCYPFITITNSGSLSSLEGSLCHSLSDWRKSFKPKKNKIRSPKLSLKKNSKPVLTSFVMHTSRMNLSRSLGDANVFSVDIALSGVRVHFHDSSCIVGTVTIPTSRSTLLTYEDYMDLLCSTEGMVLTSPWCPGNFKDFLWGPSLSHLSSILNLRVRTGKMTSQLEVSIGIQHVCCFLPPDFLAILMGYFSLPDWGSNLTMQQVNGNPDYIITEKGSSVIYKFEILDSTLIFPVEQDHYRFLKIELPQLYCSFIFNCSNDLLKDIPLECIVPMHKLAKTNHCLNIYGRDLFLSVLLFKDDKYDCLMLNEDTGCRKITLIELLNADVWVRLPCESESCPDNVSMCFMSRIASCQLISDDFYTLHGFEALMDVINQFSSVGTESTCFTSDVLQFFQLKRSLKESGGVPSTGSSMVSTEARCCANSLSIILYQSRNDSITSIPIAKAEMQLICSACLINETLIHLDLSFSTLALRSLLNSVMIAQCASAHSASSALHISFSRSTKVDAKLEVQVDRLDVWLSHQVFCFWYGVQFAIPGSCTSQSSFGSVDFKVHTRKVSLLISDERSSCGGPLLEIITKNCMFHFIIAESSVEMSVASDLEVNYNNIHKVLWEPFVESWRFQINMIRRQKRSALLNNSIATDIHLSSTVPLNLNCTESFIECVFRTAEMVNDAWHLTETTEPSENQRSSSSQYTETISRGRYAPYVLQNLTSLPLLYHVSQGAVDVDEFDASEMEEGKAVEPGASVPIYLIETLEKQLVHFRSAQSSDRLSEKQSIRYHHFMSIQLEGMSLPSIPISIDRVGVTCFEVNFSNASNKTEVEKNRDFSKYNLNTEENSRFDINSGFTVPVVFDVSVQRYSKLLRLYSTVLLLNATSMPLELRFDIPFGLSPKILDPVYPGQEFPLPVHLAESGRLRWRPLGNSYLWSEVHDLSNILSQEMKIGFLRSFVCYPRHPSSDPFRCCISVQNFSVPSSGKANKCLSPCASITKKQSVEISTHDRKQSQNKFIHQVTLSTPLVLNNYLPDTVSLNIECGGVTRSSLLSEVETSFHHVDPSHDLVLEFHVQGFKPSHLKFLRAETFSTTAKFNGSKFSLIETMIFDPESSNGPLYVTVEKTMDAFSGSREIFISVPFLIYNCTGLALNILESTAQMDGNPHTISSCYVIESELLQDKKGGLSLLSSDQDLYATASQFHGLGSSSKENRIVFSKKKPDLCLDRSMHKPVVLSGSSESSYRQSNKLDSGKKAFSFMCSSSEPTSRNSDLAETERGKIRPCMYSPCAISSLAEFMVRIKRCLPEHVAEEEPHSSWSEPFLLAPPSGSTTIHTPQSSPNASFVISVTSSALGGPVAGRAQAITFQPKYVISNACSRDLCYKQKGTELYVRLCIGQHSHLHCTDTKRDLLVSIRFNEPGWQWSGSFLPDYLGDTQVKMRNYISGALHMIRVEVQNADVSIRDEKIVGNLQGNSGTNLILLSDDDTGFMPYRIDNFSKERLRIYQQRCETFDTIIHPYTSCPYAWDEPCYPHRLIVEVPGERVVGLYALDDPKEYVPVHLKSTSEKPERTLLLSTHAEGATKVLSIVDSGYHSLKDLKDPIPSWFQSKRKYEQKPESFVDYEEKFSLSISCISVSLINAYPEELLFACAKDITLTLLQSLDQQKLSFQISSLQIDNQLRTTPYPVILSFNPECRSSAASQRAMDDIASRKSERMLQISSESCCEPVVDLAIATWRKEDMSLVSFEYISLRVADFRLELEQELILSLLDLFRSVYARFESSILPNSDPSSCPLIHDVGFTRSQTYECAKARENQQHGENVLAFSKSQIRSSSLPSVVPIGAPWQQIYFLAKRQKKIYVELFDLSPIQFTLSFSSAPWMVRNSFRTSRESIIHSGIMAFADVEGAQIHLKQLTIAHQMASWESMQDIIFRHYTRQFLHEMYKVFGSAGVIGNPMGFARSLGLGIRDFLSVPARSILQSPTGIITGMAQGTTSLLSNTVYALSDAATQFSKAAHKGIVAFTFDDQSKMEKQHKGVVLHTKGVINEVLEGLTGLLQSPIKEAEKHGLLGVLSGIAMGVTGLVARPAASILEVTGKTAQSIRNRSKLHQIGSQRYRMRLPRPLSRELPLRPYSLEEAVGTSILMEVDGLRLKDEVFVMCKSLKQAGKFAVITERLVMVISCPSLVDLMKPGFRGVPADPDWFVESEICLDSVIHVDSAEAVVHIVGSSSDALPRQNQHQSRKSGGVTRTKHWSSTSTYLPLFQTNLELASDKDAEDLLRMLLSLIEQGKVRGWGSVHLLHKGNMMWKQGNSCLLLGQNPL